MSGLGGLSQPGERGQSKRQDFGKQFREHFPTEFFRLPDVTAQISETNDFENVVFPLDSGPSISF